MSALASDGPGTSALGQLVPKVYYDTSCVLGRVIKVTRDGCIKQCCGPCTVPHKAGELLTGSGNIVSCSVAAQYAAERGCPLTSCHIIMMIIIIPSPRFNLRDMAGGAVGTASVATCNPTELTAVQCPLECGRSLISCRIGEHHIISLFASQVEHLEHLPMQHH